MQRRAADRDDEREAPNTTTFIDKSRSVRSGDGRAPAPPRKS